MLRIKPSDVLPAGAGPYPVLAVEQTADGAWAYRLPFYPGALWREDELEPAEAPAGLDALMPWVLDEPVKPPVSLDLEARLAELPPLTPDTLLLTVWELRRGLVAMAKAMARQGD